MVLDFGVSNIPMPVFMAVHIVGFLIGAYLAWRSFGGGLRTFGWAFSLYAIAEVLYMGYHLDISTFLLSHTLAEVCDLAAFILAFVGVSQNVLNRTSSVKTTTARA
jgi:hypothetical protein